MKLRAPEFLYQHIASSVLGQIDAANAAKAFRNRLRKLPGGKAESVWDTWESNLNKDELEEELLRGEDRELKARVWHIDPETKKRINAEVFVKDGEEWKWVPDKGSIWHPDFNPNEKSP